FLALQNAGAARTGTVVVAGQIFTLMQDSGCVYNLSPSAQVLPETGGSGLTSVSANTGCQWTVTSNDSWLTANGTGNGNGTFNYSASAFAGGTRTGTISVADKTLTVIQTSGCEYAISPTSQNIDAFGSPSPVSLFTRPSCSWA